MLAVLWLALVALASPVAAQNFPQLTGRVVDQAQLLSADQAADLTSKSQALEAQTGRQFVVATVNSLEGRTIEDYGYRLGRTWGIGQKGKDDGVILLLAPNERKVRIETGYGARVFLTDAVSSIIIREAILPRFKAGDMGGGIVAGADEIIKQMSLSPPEAARNANQAERAQQQRREESPGVIPVVLWIVVILFVIGSMSRRGSRGRRYRRRSSGGISPWVVLWGLNELSRASRHRDGWGGGSGWGGGGGGGFGGFSGGGGSFGGGGASGSW